MTDGRRVIGQRFSAQLPAGRPVLGRTPLRVGTLLLIGTLLLATAMAPGIAAREAFAQGAFAREATAKEAVAQQAVARASGTRESVALEPGIEPPMSQVETYIANRAGQTGVYALETGAEALRARAWLVENARQSIEAQYFIWSTDNIGTLSAEALLRAADRGVKVRVIVDDLLVDATERTLVSLERHPNVEVKIYNAVHRVGVRWTQRVWSMLTDFRGFNQRMHDKSFIVDGKIAIVGGRNMADEYYDYSRAFNFRDRDVLVLGHEVGAIQANFEGFWQDPLAQPVDVLLDRLRGSDTKAKSSERVSDSDVARYREEIRQYAASLANFEPEVRQAIASTPGEFERLRQQIHWGDVRFIHDAPGKNVASRFNLGAGGRSGQALAELVRGAREDVIIQSPYLVLSDEAIALFGEAIARGVKVRINTNSLAATDNLEAYSGYLGQRARILAMGIDVREFRPDSEVQRQLMRPFLDGRTPPKTTLHAKTMVVDGRHAFIGTYNLDPRSQNLNTEIGVIVDSPAFAGKVRDAILTDMGPTSSWNPAVDDTHADVPWTKRLKVRVLSWLPLRAIL